MANKSEMKLLLIDDQKSIRDIAKFMLQQAGFQHVDECDNGPEALQLMRIKNHNLVISDWNMEPMTGLELLQTIRKDPRLAKTPFIMMTGQADAKYVQIAAKAGVNNYVVKPFSAEVIQKKIEQVFGKLAA